jgi:hypothetical protein
LAASDMASKRESDSGSSCARILELANPNSLRKAFNVPIPCSTSARFRLFIAFA